MRKSYATTPRSRKLVVKNASILASIGFLRMMKLFLLGALFGSIMMLLAVVHFFKLDLGKEISKVDFMSLVKKPVEVVATPVAKTKKPTITKEKVKDKDEGIKFEFYNMLQGKKDSDTAESAAKNDYFLKIASLQSEEDANILRQKLEAQGYHVSIKNAVIDGISWWRVYVGPFKTLRETYDIQNNLRAEDIDSILVKGKI